MSYINGAWAIGLGTPLFEGEKIMMLIIIMVIKNDKPTSED